MNLPPLWPHQERGLAELWNAIDNGAKRICFTAATGSGKSLLQIESALEGIRRGWKVLMITNRIMLTEQTSTVMEKVGVSHGVMAAGFEHDFDQPVQIASIQTLDARVFKRVTWELPDSDLILVDEAHNVKGDQAMRVINAFTEKGKVIVGWTATPVGIGGIYNTLVSVTTKEELRKTGALVPAVTYAPDEPDMTNAKRNSDGEFVVDEVVRRIMVHEAGERRPRIFGSVIKHLMTINPHLLPTLLFAPDVAGSRWFVEEFKKAGITAAHIDGETPPEERRRIVEGSKNGEIQVICHRMVLREGIDLPWLRHGIFATAFGTISGYIQSGGRMLRAFPGKDKVTIQDHGGNWHRHISLNEDVEWKLEDTDVSIARELKASRQKPGNQDQEPLCCPQCGGLRRFGNRCPFCGHEHQRSVRMVVQTDGTLKKQVGCVHKPKREVPDAEKHATGVFWRAMKSSMTFGQLHGLHRKLFGSPFPDGVVRYRGGLVRLPERSDARWDQPVREMFK